jgi:hypothetical protein
MPRSEANGTDKPKPFVISERTRIAILILSEADVGDTITYKELSRQLGVDVREKGRGYITRARAKLMREARIVFDPIPTVGLKRLSDAEIADKSERHPRQIRRRAQRGRQFADCVQDESKLTNAQRQGLMMRRAQYGAIEAFSSTAGGKALAQPRGAGAPSVGDLVKQLQKEYGEKPAK